MITRIGYRQTMVIGANRKGPIQVGFGAKNRFSIFATCEKIGFSNQITGTLVVLFGQLIKRNTRLFPVSATEMPALKKQVS